jgi:hypothetical protein
MNNRTITPDQILDMLRSASMALREMVRELHVDEEALHAPIAELLSKGRIRVGGVREVRYCLVRDSSKKKVRERLNTPVAAVRAPPPLKGEIKGYADAMRQRVELAMLGRGRG